MMRELGEIEDTTCPRCGDEKENPEQYYCQHCYEHTEALKKEME